MDIHLDYHIQIEELLVMLAPIQELFYKEFLPLNIKDLVAMKHIQ